MLSHIEGCGLRRTRQNRNFRSVFDDWTSFRANGLRPTLQNRNSCPSFWRSKLIPCERLATDTSKIAILPVLDDRTSFRAKAFLWALENHNFTSEFNRSNLISCERVALDACKSQFYPSFSRSNLALCERVAFRGASLALPRASREK